MKKIIFGIITLLFIWRWNTFALHSTNQYLNFKKIDSISKELSEKLKDKNNQELHSFIVSLEIKYRDDYMICLILENLRLRLWDVVKWFSLDNDKVYFQLNDSPLLDDKKRLIDRLDAETFLIADPTGLSFLAESSYWLDRDWFYYLQYHYWSGWDSLFKRIWDPTIQWNMRLEGRYFLYWWNVYFAWNKITYADFDSFHSDPYDAWDCKMWCWWMASEAEAQAYDKNHKYSYWKTIEE